MQQDSQDIKQPTYNRDILRCIVRNSYDIQQMRIQTGNRVCAAFRTKLGLEPSDTEDTVPEAKEIFTQLRESSKRITDGIATNSMSLLKLKKLKFPKGELIQNLAELTMAEQYFMNLENETRLFGQLGLILNDIPVYRDFLSQVDGVGPQMAAVLISEIDIHRSKYASSLHAYAGLDVVIYGEYTDDNGVKKTIRASELEAMVSIEDLHNHYQVTVVDGMEVDKPIYLAEGKYPVELKSMGRGKKDVCLVKTEYLDKNKKTQLRDSITYNPWLKTKLLGVLAGSFLKKSVTYVNEEKMGAAKRLLLAKSLGYGGAVKGCDDFLKERGYVFRQDVNHYAKIYYDYKHRLENHRNHKDKTDGHRHAMAMRYMIKMFLIDYYKAARTCEGLKVWDDYATAKLGLMHGQDI